jgi:hypothetical protein
VVGVFASPNLHTVVTHWRCELWGIDASTAVTELHVVWSPVTSQVISESDPDAVARSTLRERGDPPTRQLCMGLAVCEHLDV